MATNLKMEAPLGTGPKARSSNRSGLFSKGPIGIVVVGLHLALIYAVAVSLGIVELPGLAKPMEAVIIDSPPAEKSEPVPIVKPDLDTPLVDTPPLEDTIPEIEVPTDEPAPNAITAETSPSPPVAETANMKVNRRVDPVYPAGSRRDGEQGHGHVPCARRREGPSEGRAGAQEQRPPASGRGGDDRHSQMGFQPGDAELAAGAVVDPRAGDVQPPELVTARSLGGGGARAVDVRSMVRACPPSWLSSGALCDHNAPFF